MMVNADQFNEMLRRRQERWECIQLCSPVKVWVLTQMYNRNRGAVYWSHDTPPARERARRLGDILAKCGAAIQLTQRLQAIMRAYPGVTEQDAQHLYNMWGHYK